MAKLTDDEANLLKKLTAKAKAPDAPPSERRLNISIDLADEAQVTRAQRLGLLDMFTDDGTDDGDDGGGDDGDDGKDEPPARKGFFPGS